MVKEGSFQQSDLDLPGVRIGSGQRNEPRTQEVSLVQ
jgi:hypothetical protein